MSQVYELPHITPQQIAPTYFCLYMPYMLGSRLDLDTFLYLMNKHRVQNLFLLRSHYEMCEERHTA